MAREGEGGAHVLMKEEEAARADWARGGVATEAYFGLILSQSRRACSA